MTYHRLKDATVDELVARFVEIALAQDQALLEDNIAKVNRLFDRLQEVIAELKSRDGDQRRALLPLYQHPNMQVRVHAAKTTLALAPEAAKKQLAEIRASNWQPQAGDAGMALRMLERGIYKPT